MSPDLQKLITDVAGDLLDGDIDKPETSAELRSLAVMLGQLASGALSARYGFVGGLLGIAASKAIADAFEKFIADKTAK